MNEEFSTRRFCEMATPQKQDFVKNLFWDNQFACECVAMSKFKFFQIQREKQIVSLLKRVTMMLT